MRPNSSASAMCTSADPDGLAFPTPTFGPLPTEDPVGLDSYQIKPLVPDFLSQSSSDFLRTSLLATLETKANPIIPASQKMAPPQFEQFDLDLSVRVDHAQDHFIDGFGGALKLHFDQDARIESKLNYHEGFHPQEGLVGLASLTGVNIRLDNKYVADALAKQFGMAAGMAYQLVTDGQEAFFDFTGIFLETKSAGEKNVSRLIFEVAVHVGDVIFNLRLPAASLASFTENETLDALMTGDWQTFDADFQQKIFQGANGKGGLFDLFPEDAFVVGRLDHVTGIWNLPQGENVTIESGTVNFDFSEDAFGLQGDLSVMMGENSGNIVYQLQQDSNGGLTGRVEGDGHVQSFDGFVDLDLFSDSFDWRDLFKGNFGQGLELRYHAEGESGQQTLSLDGEAMVTTDGIQSTGQARLPNVQTTVVNYSLDSDLGVTAGSLALDPFTMTLAPGLDVVVALTSVGSRSGSVLSGLASLTVMPHQGPAIACEVPINVDLADGIVSFSHLHVTVPDVALRFPKKGITLKAKEAILSGDATYDLRTRCLTGPLKLSVAKASLDNQKQPAHGFVLGSPLTLEARLTGIFDPLQRGGQAGGLTLPLEAFEVILHSLKPMEDGRIQVDVGVSSRFEPARVKRVSQPPLSPVFPSPNGALSQGLFVGSSPVHFSDRQIALERYGLTAGGESILSQILPNLQTGVVRSKGIHLRPDADGRLQLGPLSFKVPDDFSVQLETFVRQGRVATLDLNFVPPLIGAVRVNGIHFDPASGQFRLVLDGPAGMAFPDLGMNRIFFELLGLDEAGLLALSEQQGINWKHLPDDAKGLMEALLFALVYRDGREMFDAEYTPQKSRLDLTEAELIFEGLKPKSGTKLALGGMTAILGEEDQKSLPTFSGGYKFSDGRLALSCKGLNRLALTTKDSANPEILVMKTVDIGSIVYRRTAGATEFTLQNLKVGSMSVQADSIPALSDLVEDLRFGASGDIQISHLSVLSYANEKADWVDVALAFSSQAATADLSLALGGKHGRAHILPATVGGEAYFRFRTDMVLPQADGANFSGLSRPKTPVQALFLESGDMTLTSEQLTFSELAFDPDLEFHDAQTKKAKIAVHLGGPDGVSVKVSGDHSWSSEQTSLLTFDTDFLTKDSLTTAQIDSLKVKGPATLTFTPRALTVVGGFDGDPFLVTTSGHGVLHKGDNSEIGVTFAGLQTLEKASLSLSKNGEPSVRVEEVSLRDVDFALTELNGHLDATNSQMPLAMDFTNNTGHFAAASVYQTPQSTFLDGANLRVLGEDSFDVSADILFGDGLVELTDMTGTLATEGDGTQLSVASQ